MLLFKLEDMNKREEKAIMFCSKCGAKMVDGARFCEGCGTVVKAQSKDIPLESSNAEVKTLFSAVTEKKGQSIPIKKKLQWWHVLLIVLGGIIILISAMTAIVHVFNDTNEDTNNYENNNQMGSTSDSNVVNVGSIIKFGAYEQDNNYDNGDEEIEWIVLEVSGDKLLLVSKYVLEASSYTGSEYGSSWEDSNVNTCLTDIYTNAFSYQEKKKLTTGTIKSDDGSYTPSDLVFALSSTEFEKYASVVSGLYNCYPTAYAKARGALVSSSEETAGKSYWWVRDDSTYGTVMTSSGVAWVGTMFKEDEHGVRPAIWISVDYQIESGVGITVSNDMVGTWDTASGGDEHTITISADGKMTFIDGSDTLTVNYICYSATEIAIRDSSMVFILSNGKLIRYDKDGLKDGYTYSKRVNTPSSTPSTSLTTQMPSSTATTTTPTPVNVATLEYFTGHDFALENNVKDNLGNMHNNVVFPVSRGWSNAATTNEYKLNKQYSRLSGTWFQLYDFRTEVKYGIGATDYPSVLEIYGDGILLYAGNMKAGVEPKEIDLDISGVTELKIYYFGGGSDGSYSGIADFNVQK